jgi:RNA polymerase subunit RPABC4/transcription elongation factor Spt4
VSKVVDQFGATLTAFGDQPFVRLATTLVVLYAVIVWLASAWWVFHDLRRRHQSSAAPYLGATFVVMASPIAFPLAVAVYRIVRPRETLGEARYRRLENRLTQLHVQEDLTCADCGSSVDEDWLLCPACQAPLGYRCAVCERTMATDWSLCAWCGTEIEEPTTLDAPERRAQPAIAGDEQHAPEVPVFQPQPEVATV